jgi:hypothetical protein
VYLGVMAAFAVAAAVALAALALTRRLPPGPSVVDDRQAEALGIGAAGFSEDVVRGVPPVTDH